MRCSGFATHHETDHSTLSPVWAPGNQLIIRQVRLDHRLLEFFSFIASPPLRKPGSSQGQTKEARVLSQPPFSGQDQGHGLFAWIQWPSPPLSPVYRQTSQFFKKKRVLGWRDCISLSNKGRVSARKSQVQLKESYSCTHLGEAPSSQENREHSQQGSQLLPDLIQKLPMRGNLPGQPQTCKAPCPPSL